MAGVLITSLTCSRCLVGPRAAGTSCAGSCSFSLVGLLLPLPPLGFSPGPGPAPPDLPVSALVGPLVALDGAGVWELLVTDDDGGGIGGGAGAAATVGGGDA